ncbi:MAG: long-chain N-acyl amino acid synthase [Rhodocyclaceae bacterium]
MSTFEASQSRIASLKTAYHALPRRAVTNDSSMLHSLGISPTDDRDSREFVLSRSDFQIRLGNGADGQRSNVSMLIQRMYAWRGLLTHAPSRIDDQPNQLTLIASRGTTMFGTLTLKLDSDEGLLADELYSAEISAARRTGAQLCELTRLAIDPAFNSKEVLASIFHLAYIFGRLIHRKTDLFIEVNPRHVGFYCRMLGFRVAGEERICPRVSAPAVLLHLPLEYVDEQIKAVAGRPDTGSRSLYSYFFNETEQKGLLNRLQADPSLLTL